MAPRKQGRNRYKKSRRGGMLVLAAILTLVVITAAMYIFWRHGSQVPNTELHKQLPPVISTRAMPERPAEYANVTSLTLKNMEGQKTPHPEQASGGQSARQTEQKFKGSGLLAVVIDDMGSSMAEARALAGIGVPLTFSIIPGLRNYREVASFAASSGIETMIHLPMQSKGWPQRRLEANGLLISMDDGAIDERLAGFMKDIPRAVGANNHMGSEFTEHDEKMRVVLGTLKAKGLFFIDSVTTPRSAGLRLAHEMGVRSARRDVFLDNEQNEAYIRGQLNQAIRLAQKRGAAIAIGHPHPATIKALAALLPGLVKQGITLVPASRLVR